MASQQPMKKNTAARIVFPIYDSSADLLSGATGLDSEYSLDGGAFADCTNEATEIGTAGFYYLDLVAAETNGDVVAIEVKTTSATGKTSALVFYTSAQTLDEMDAVNDAIKLKTDNLPADPATVTKQDAIISALGTVPADVWAEVLDGTYTAKEITQIMVAILAGETTITETASEEATVYFRDLADTVNRVVATMEKSERTAVVIT